jgi:hypothetical protein
VKNVSKDEIQGKIGKIYMPDQKVRRMFIHLAAIALTMGYLTISRVGLNVKSTLVLFSYSLTVYYNLVIVCCTIDIDMIPFVFVILGFRLEMSLYLT